MTQQEKTNPAPVTQTVGSDVVKMLATMTGLVKLKYGNLDAEIWKLVQEAEKLIEGASV